MLNKVKAGALAVLLSAPAIIWAWPQAGDPAPDVSVPDTTWAVHAIPSEYRGNVVQLFFWRST